jgi:hypothetical protein
LTCLSVLHPTGLCLHPAVQRLLKGVLSKLPALEEAFRETFLTDLSIEQFRQDGPPAG